MKDNSHYELWKARFEKHHGTGGQTNRTQHSGIAIGPYKVELFNAITEKWENFTCSIACAVAFLESQATDFDFLPEKIEIKYKLEGANVRYAIYNDSAFSNREDGTYLIFFGATGDCRVYLN